MSDYLPQLSFESVRGFLEARIGRPPDALRQLANGEHSQAFSFDVGAERLVLRFSRVPRSLPLKASRIALRTYWIRDSFLDP